MVAGYASHYAWLVISEAHGRNPRSPIVASHFAPWQSEIVSGAIRPTRRASFARALRAGVYIDTHLPSFSYRHSPR
ncbi:hypothetical protein C0Z18_15850 [Trinickia dabaoshanensis]|uniref:Uncharacterized protein n=1 Tax=Trinickia dabaoshanensis TaxID=564714 RepID=A0A2N7VNR6_9BURK|nr:hypothetical protein C0Z18_15850 [Trinickia dabaoshanensis]